MMNQRIDDLLNRVKNINVNSRQGHRPSPHKPLLLLLSIGRHLNGHDGLAIFEEIEGELNGLIRRYGLPNSRENAHYPFWHREMPTFLSYETKRFAEDLFQFC